MSIPPIEEVVAAFDEEALIRNLLRVAADNFPPFVGAPRALQDAAVKAALLLDAAPTMYAALKSFRACELCGNDYGRCGTCDRRADDAIARAEGR